MYRNSIFVRHQIYFLINTAVIYSISSAPWGGLAQGQRGLAQAPPSASWHARRGGQRQGAVVRPGQQLRLKPWCRAPENQMSSPPLQAWDRGWVGNASSEMGWRGAQGEVGPRQRLGVPLAVTACGGEGLWGHPSWKGRLSQQWSVRPLASDKLPTSCHPQDPPSCTPQPRDPSKGPGPLSSGMFRAEGSLR